MVILLIITTMVNPWKKNHLFTCAHIPYPLLLESHITKNVNFIPSPIQRVALSSSQGKLWCEELHFQIATHFSTHGPSKSCNANSFILKLWSQFWISIMKSLIARGCSQMHCHSKIALDYRVMNIRNKNWTFLPFITKVPFMWKNVIRKTFESLVIQ
jgi:hypothetical protein